MTAENYESYDDERVIKGQLGQQKHTRKVLEVSYTRRCCYSLWATKASSLRQVCFRFDNVFSLISYQRSIMWVRFLCVQSTKSNRGAVATSDRKTWWFHLQFTRSCHVSDNGFLMWLTSVQILSLLSCFFILVYLSSYRGRYMRFHY